MINKYNDNTSTVNLQDYSAAVTTSFRVYLQEIKFEKRSKNHHKRFYQAVTRLRRKIGLS
jgi:hypothetical protein